METSNYTTYDKPYPTIGDLIKGKDYDCISYRIAYPGCDEEHGTLPAIFQLKTGKAFLWMGIFTNLMKK